MAKMTNNRLPHGSPAPNAVNPAVSAAGGGSADRKPVVVPRPISEPMTHGDIAIVAVGYQPHKTEWIDHRFALHAVGLVTAGRGRYRMHSLPEPAAGIDPAAALVQRTTSVDTAARTIEPGTMFTVFPGPVFTYGATPDPAWEEYYFCAVGSGTRRWVDFGWFPVDGTVHRLAQVDVAVELYRELLRIQRRGAPGDADRAVTLAERLLIEMFHGRETARQAQTLDGSLQAVLTWCRQNFAQPVDFTAVARDHAMSYSSLRQRVRQATGLPPAQYLIHLRCSRAQALLSDTDMSIKAIGTAVGIGDPFAFSRTFKKCVGLSPAQFRRETAPWARRPLRGGPPA